MLLFPTAMITLAQTQSHSLAKEQMKKTYIFHLSKLLTTSCHQGIGNTKCNG